MLIRQAVPFDLQPYAGYYQVVHRRGREAQLTWVTMEGLRHYLASPGIEVDLHRRRVNKFGSVSDERLFPML